MGQFGLGREGGSIIPTKVLLVTVRWGLYSHSEVPKSSPCIPQPTTLSSEKMTALDCHNHVQSLIICSIKTTSDPAYQSRWTQTLAWQNSRILRGLYQLAVVQSLRDQQWINAVNSGLLYGSCVNLVATCLYVSSPQLLHRQPQTCLTYTSHLLLRSVGWQNK